MKTLLLAAGLVLGVALLTDLGPGRDGQTAAAAAKVTGPPVLPALDAALRARELGTRVLAVAAAPHGKKADVQVTVVGPDAMGVDGLRISVGSPGKFRRTISCGPGCYSVTIPRKSPLTLVVRGVGAPQRFSFGKFPAPNGARLLDRVTRAFKSSRSVEYTERLASSPSNALVTTYVLQRPDRLHFHVRGGHEAIIIGIRRWDRDPGRPWVQSPQTLIQQPSPAWRTVLTNASLLGKTRTTYHLGFLDRTSSAFPAWFDTVVSRKTLLPRSLRMTAASHFMHHTYTRWDRAATIRPPKT